MNDLTNYMIEDVDGYDEFDDTDNTVLESVTEELDSYDLDDDSVMESVIDMVMEGDPNNPRDAYKAAALACKLDAKFDKAAKTKSADKTYKALKRSSAVYNKYDKKIIGEFEDKNYFREGLNAFKSSTKKKDIPNLDINKSAVKGKGVVKKKKAKEDVDGYDEFDRLVDEAIEDAEYYNETGDDIDALLESIEADYDIATEEFSAATKTVASTQSMINAGYSKDKAIKHMNILISYLRKHNMLAINIENVDEHTVLTRKHLTGDGVSFLKKYYEKFDGIKSAENDKLKGKLDNALKEYAKDTTKINDVVNAISLAIGGCGLFSIPLLIIYFGFGGSKKFINKTFNLDENTAVEDADYDDEIIDEDLMFDDDDDYTDDLLDSTTESALFIDFMLESCDTFEEFEELVNENATDWQLYGLIDDREMALEATRIMKVENWKQKNRYRLIRRECIRIGKEKNDPNYIKYKKYRDLMRQFRQKLFDKYETLATRNVKAAHKNSVAKASNVKTASGKTTLTRLGVDSHATSQANAQMNKAKNGNGIAAAHTNSKKKLV